MWVSNFPPVWVFLPYSNSYRVCVSFYTFFSAYRHIPGHTVFLSHFPLFSVFSPQSWSYKLYFIFQVFNCFFLHYSMSYSVCFSFWRFSVYLPIFHVLPCEFLIFLVCQFSRHIPGPTM
jgi:hypothetical protein